MAEKISNTFNSAVGGAKESLGKALGNQQMAADGAAARAQAQAKQASADAKRNVDGMVDNIQGRVSSTMGAAKGDHSQEARGKIQETTGDAKRAMS